MNNIQTKLLYAYTSKHLFAIMQDDAHFITQEIEQLLSSLQNCDKQACVDLCLGHNINAGRMCALQRTRTIMCCAGIRRHRQTDRPMDAHQTAVMLTRPAGHEAKAEAKKTEAEDEAQNFFRGRGQTH